MNKNRKSGCRNPTERVEIKSCHVAHLHERAMPLVQAGGNVNVDLG